MIRKGATGDEIDSLQVGLSKMVVYLVDWSITDADDQPVIIRGQSEDVVADVLEMLDVDSFAEILKAIETHERTMEAEREEEKKTGHWEQQVRSDLAIARVFSWRYEWVAELDRDVYRVLVESLSEQVDG